jgi:hypothetical protein
MTLHRDHLVLLWRQQGLRHSHLSTKGHWYMLNVSTNFVVYFVTLPHICIIMGVITIVFNDLRDFQLKPIILVFNSGWQKNLMLVFFTSMNLQTPKWQDQRAHFTQSRPPDDKQACQEGPWYALLPWGPSWASSVHLLYFSWHWFGFDLKPYIYIYTSEILFCNG